VGRLDRVASYFNLADGDYFWATDIKKFLAPPPPKPDRLISMKQKINWPYAQRLLNLLETGQHDFLRELIDRLYAASLSAPAITPAQERERADPPCHMTDAWRPQESGDELVGETNVPAPAESKKEPPLVSRMRSRLHSTREERDQTTDEGEGAGGRGRWT
jgi:hypothetical protein